MKKKTIRSRRRFISEVMACSLPFLIPSTVLGRNGHPSPNETINVGLIGYGVRQSLVGNRPGARFVAICDCDTRRIPHGNPNIQGFQDYREMLEMPSLDVVSIATPDHWHTRMTIDACKAGKDVFCEKPLTFTLMESRQIVQAARKYNRVVSSGSQRIMEDYGRYIAPIILSGAIGEVREIHCTCKGAPTERIFTEQPIPTELNWDLWLGQAPWIPYNIQLVQPMTWRFHTNFGTGGLGDWGGHNFGGALYSCGMDHIAPKEVFAPHSEGNPTEGTMILMENGVKFYHRESGPQIRIVGSEKTYVFNRQNPYSVRPLHAVDVRRYHGGAEILADDFLFCVRNRLRPFQDVFYGANVSDYGHMCILAYKLNRHLVWDKEKMVFTGDPQATALVSRVQRPPYVIEV